MVELPVVEEVVDIVGNVGKTDFCLQLEQTTATVTVITATIMTFFPMQSSVDHNNLRFVPASIFSRFAASGGKLGHKKIKL